MNTAKFDSYKPANRTYVVTMKDERRPLRVSTVAQRRPAISKPERKPAVGVDVDALVSQANALADAQHRIDALTRERDALRLQQDHSTAEHAAYLAAKDAEIAIRTDDARALAAQLENVQKQSCQNAADVVQHMMDAITKQEDAEATAQVGLDAMSDAVNIMEALAAKPAKGKPTVRASSRMRQYKEEAVALKALITEAKAKAERDELQRQYHALVATMRELVDYNYENAWAAWREQLLRIPNDDVEIGDSDDDGEFDRRVSTAMDRLRIE